MPEGDNTENLPGRPCLWNRSPQFTIPPWMVPDGSTRLGYPHQRTKNQEPRTKNHEEVGHSFRNKAPGKARGSKLEKSTVPVMKTEAIKYLLTKHTHPDLAALYDPGLEVQVSVAQDGGDKVEQEFKGRQYAAWTDGRTTWKNFRIPLNANTEPEDNDGPMNFNLEAHVEGIGLTGWYLQGQGLEVGRL